MSKLTQQIASVIPIDDKKKAIALAEKLIHAYNTQDELLAAAKWAEKALAPFYKEPAEKSGISKLRKAIANAENLP